MFAFLDSKNSFFFIFVGYVYATYSPRNPLSITFFISQQPFEQAKKPQGPLWSCPLWPCPLWPCPLWSCPLVREASWKTHYWCGHIGVFRRVRTVSRAINWPHPSHHILYGSLPFILLAPYFQQFYSFNLKMDKIISKPIGANDYYKK